MKRISTFFAFLFLLFLASCGAAGTETAVTTSPSDTASPAASENESPALTPASNVAAAAQLRADDQTHGAAEPAVTIIEYGDFQ